MSHSKQPATIVSVLSNYSQEVLLGGPYPSYTGWGVLLNDARVLPQADQSPENIQDFIRFAEPFFTPQYLSQLLSNFRQLSQSQLSLSFTLRCPNISILESILHDLEVEFDQTEQTTLIEFILPDLTGVHQHVRLSNGGTSSRRGKACTGPSAHLHPPRQVPLINNGQAFQEAPIIVVASDDCPASESTRRGRTQTLQARSSAFRNHELLKPVTAKLYEPEDDHPDQIIHLFHGTRTSSLQRFFKRGIHHVRRPNEYSTRMAFYVSNDPQQAYEYPLHLHPAHDPQDHISVLQFDLESSVLHGESPPGEGQEAFKVLWYNVNHPETDRLEWQQFCAGNLNETLYPEHDYDIVMGPTFIPPLPGTPTDTDSTQIPSTSTSTTQVAFCTQRSRDWMNQKIACIYKEDRTLQA
ncbi:hypothetical protein PSHT_04569 [Puccinia striiformis]|uniref:PARP catalytic domain-containing protein n=1 Tax=Puccinia striiformis TaxID=27350 RepID=A0A2S4WCM1_9BASI|nr:hypothetical protein PSHT_04569 [Puccinia striiformis]